MKLKKKRAIFVMISIVCFTNSFGQTKNSNSIQPKDVVSHVEIVDNKRKVNMGFVRGTDGLRFDVSLKIEKRDKTYCVKIKEEKYFLKADTLPSFVNELCGRLKQIEPDSSVKFGEPLAKSVVVAILIDKNGELVSLGLVKKSNDEYYDKKTSGLLESINTTGFEPAKLDSKPVGVLLRVLFVFGEGKCRVIE